MYGRIMEGRVYRVDGGGGAAITSLPLALLMIH